MQRKNLNFLEERKLALENYHSKQLESLLEQLDVRPEDGLSKQEIQTRLETYGYNQLEHKKGKSLFSILLEQLLNPIVALLAVAGTIAFVFDEFVEGAAVLVVIGINTAIGFFMELQARNSMLKLRKITKVLTTVIRDGRMQDIDSTEIVPGDIVYLEAGDMIPADSRIIENHNLAVKEAALTGESTQVYKSTELPPENAPLAERSNCVFKGTVVTNGNAKALVIKTGVETELGQISKMAQDATKAITPLDLKLKNLSKKLIWLTIILALLLLGLGLYQGKDLILMIETAIALAVAAIPEGLPVIATISLARGMVRLSYKNVIVKTLEAVETLGETNVILTDKTGTLTENEMHVDTLVLSHQDIQKSDFQQSLLQDQGTKQLIQTGVLSNNAEYHKSGKTGDPIDLALLELADQLNPDYLKETSKEFELIEEVPFDSDLKMMGTLHKWKDKYIVSVKGATEKVLEKCDYILEGQKESSFNNPEEWLKKEKELASNGLRTLSFAFKILPEKPDPIDLEKNPFGFISNLTFIGIAGFIDPIRSDIKESIHTCKSAGIKVIMITGDHIETARNISKEIELIGNGREEFVLHGSDIDISNSNHHEKILKAAVFARVSPAQKLELVSLHQSTGDIVGMTGDGVNDAPALKKADIGIAMGIRGTEAAKDVADIILKDDAFSSILLAIKQGRIIFENIRKFVVYLLSCNLSEILSVTLASLLNLPLPLLPLQILFLNLVTDVFPALAIGMDEGEKDIMSRNPRDPKEPIITKTHWISIFSYGVAITLGVTAITLTGHYFNYSDQVINNMAFSTLILAQLFNVLNLPTHNISFFFNEITKNVYIWGAILLCIIITVLAYLLPPVKVALSLTYLNISQLSYVIIFSMLPILLVQLCKRIFKVIS